MSKLVPVRRMNKDGVMCTKWVLPESSKASSSSIPAPAIAATVPAFDVARSQIAVLFHRHRINYSDLTIQDFDLGAVQAVEWMLKSARENDRAWRAEPIIEKVLDEVNFEFQPSMRGEVDAMVPFNNLAVFGEVLMHPEAKSSDLDALVRGLRQFPNDRDFLNEGTETEREQAVALVTVASLVDPSFTAKHYSDYESSYVRLKSSELQGFIMERPDSAHDIARLVNERETDDIAVIREIIEFEQQALREGIL